MVQAFQDEVNDPEVWKLIQQARETASTAASLPPGKLKSKAPLLKSTNRHSTPAN